MSDNRALPLPSPMEEVVVTEPSVDPSPPAAELFQVGVLEALLVHESVCLTSKRALVCVNKLCEAMTLEHLHLKELHVDASDCTVTNARWILDELMVPKRVPDLRLCVKGELFAPKMKLKEIAAKKLVRISDDTSRMGATAAFFLGHALATSDGLVRLTNGRQKRLRALRENPRVQLLANETFEEVDVNLMAGALLLNAERRVDHLRLGECYVSLSTLEIDDRRATELGKHLRQVIKKHQFQPSTLNLAHNTFGSDGLCGLLLPSYGALGVVPKSNILGSNVTMDLILNGVSLGCEGVKRLAEDVLAHDRLVLRGLSLANVNVGAKGIAALVDVYARRSKTQWGHGAGGLVTLDLSGNPLTSHALAPLRKVYAFPCLRVLRLHNMERLHTGFWPRLAIAIVRDKRLPEIQSVHSDASMECSHFPLRRAITLMRSRRASLEAQSKWDDWECQNLANYLSDELSEEREHVASRRKRRALGEIKDHHAPQPHPLEDDDELDDDTART